MATRTLAALGATLLVSCASSPHANYPYAEGWRTLTLVGSDQQTPRALFRDCRSAGPGPFVLLRETQKVGRFTYLRRDWLMPRNAAGARPGDAVVANQNSCAAGYHLISR